MRTGKEVARLMKVLLTRAGEHTSVSTLLRLNSAINYLEVGRWLPANGFESSPRFSNRELLFSAIADRIRFEKVLFLEFGVYRGASLLSWSKLLMNPLSSLHGFDSFEGLPEDWDWVRAKGTFDQGKEPPIIDDPRVCCHVGWFDKTLPAFVLPEHERLLIHLDADLYSSTKFVLETLRPEITTGTIIMLDEFCDRLHELRAFSQFIEATQLKFRFLGATTTLEQVAFECVT
jgi:O-methyltransferase